MIRCTFACSCACIYVRVHVCQELMGKLDVRVRHNRSYLRQLQPTPSTRPFGCSSLKISQHLAAEFQTTPAITDDTSALRDGDGRREATQCTSLSPSSCPVHFLSHPVFISILPSGGGGGGVTGEARESYFHVISSYMFKILGGAESIDRKSVV